MQDVIFQRYLDLPEVQTWLEKVRGTLFAHGYDLVTTLPGTDNVARAEGLLQALLDRNWIVQEKRAPTREQLFLGVGGQLGGSTQSTTVFGYSPGPNIGVRP